MRCNARFRPITTARGRKPSTMLPGPSPRAQKWPRRHTASGIAPDDVPRALEPFAQLDEGHSRRAGGGGLGLPLARTFIELQGGSLEIRTAPGEGTQAVVRLPEAPAG